MTDNRNPRSDLWGTLFALAAAVVLCLLVLLLGSRQPGAAAASFFSGPLRNSYAFGNMLSVAGILVFTGLGAAFAFKTGVFNLGGEGQIYLASLVAAQTALFMEGLAIPFAPVVPILAAMLSAGVVAGLSGLFRAIWEADELISSFLISQAILPVISYLIQGPLKDPDTNLLATERIPEAFELPSVLGPSQANIGLFLALAVTLAVAWFLRRTRFGYELRMTGLNQEFSEYGGIPVRAYFVLAMLVSGALHGAGGAVLVAGVHQSALVDVSAGYGWNGIAVALIGRTSPLGVIPAALVFAYLDAGAKAASRVTDFSFELGTLIRGTIFLLITARIAGPPVVRRITAAVESLKSGGDGT